ncbi:LD-carboxypeptidase [Domibacillus sp. DTU_2020_1001157_1_SI_ALB_TIR_016]|uniref:S66 peptidase family protein n=1 Tax=Domibacillus sp. DTU_2020_1001157_1_SI_ALB_TIR_016 TaxID=3077789 RepID=UPI0028E41E71|nr:LD-carboxypeptidase [Domibacillus sp. DTU_2020_1001157_1_SI_ALB_TIR_016]WNS78004.1 LD-carboxypeptidase [Domibacillus sp. DTU_2020_1001157_1_SI_ALB_TIR_016]
MPVKPRILQRGDTVGIVALGSPVASSIIDASIAFLQGMGLQVVLGKYVYAQNGFLAGTAQQRAEDLMSMFTNTQVQMILPVRGGVGVESILPFLDYTVIAQNPKIVSGYSDITVLLNILYQFTDLITFHSLLLIDFRPQTPAYNFEQFFTITSSTVSPRPILNPPGMPLTGRVQGNVSGPIVGGNLTSIVSTLGTPYEINTTGKIILLEETHEPINTVYRYIDHMRMAGKFEDCLGIIMGECTDCPNAYGKSYNDLISEFIVPLGKPLMTNLASGHGFYKAAIPIGARVNLNTSNNTITLLEAVVS